MIQPDSNLSIIENKTQIGVFKVARRRLKAAFDALCPLMELLQKQRPVLNLGV